MLVLSLQVLTASLSRRDSIEEPVRSDITVAVLIPAHDEAIVIGETIKSLLPQLKHDDYLLVVADNCSDDTALLAEEAGARVLSRQDPHRLGKGYALDYGISQIAGLYSKPDIVVVVDADCIVAENGLEALVSKCASLMRPVQARYLMYRSSDSPGQKIAEFAWLVKNWVRPLGYMRLGLPCQLMGTGMAFPFKLLQNINLAGSNIVEDMQLGIDLARAGYPPHFCPQALVESSFPSETDSIRSQRTRWEHGHLQTILAEGFKLFGQGLLGRKLKLLAMALDLMVPPLAFLAISLLLLLLSILVLALVNLTGLLPLAMSTTVCGLFGVTVLLAWSVFARHILSPRELISIPAYILRKVPIYVRFWNKRQKDWIRTGRD